MSYFGLTHCLLGDFACFCCWLIFFQNQFFRKNVLEIPPECLTFGSISDLGPKILLRLSADDTRGQRFELNPLQNKTMGML